MKPRERCSLDQRSEEIKGTRPAPALSTAARLAWILRTPVASLLRKRTFIATKGLKRPIARRQGCKYNPGYRLINLYRVVYFACT